MTALPINPSKIKSPFADDAFLRRELQRFAEFFDGIAKDADELHAGWNRFQNRHGDVAAVQLSLAIDTLKILHAVHDRLNAAGDDGIGGLLVVFHIAMMELVERGRYIAFPDWLLGRLKEADAPLPTDVTIPAMREYLKAQKQDYESDHGAAKSVIRALQQGLSVSEKRELLLAFRFRDPNPPPGTPPVEKFACLHLHCRELKAAGKFVDPGCMSCRPPADHDLDRFIGLLARHFYAMRSGFFHRATWVWFARIPLEMDGGVEYSGTMVDGYYDKDNRVVTYEVTILLNDLIKILRCCIWNRLAM